MLPALDILVVEDDPDLAKLTSEALERYGFRVTAANTFKEAHYYLRHRVFDAVLADLFLDAMDAASSWRDVATLRTSAPLIPFGLLSGTKITDATIEQHGLSFALLKPARLEAIVAAITSCLPAVATLPPDRQATVRSYFASLEQADWDRLESICTDNVVYDLPADSDTFRAAVAGRAAFRQFTEATFARFREPRFAMQDLRALPRGALVRYEGSWNDPSGCRASLPGAVLFRFEGDRIAEIAIRIEPPVTDVRGTP
ncbi:MAG: nuclear transport factor 2 family protein [Deltaproteobacteria bacterium]|nr:nuclear transport factor 2 family protein [Deltaproteobacteria bacterium]